MEQRKTRILLVEDDPVIREHYGVLLATEGYEVSQAGTGTYALSLFHKHRPELVLLDVHLPDMDGRDLCEIIKSDATSPNTAVILVSGEATRGADKAIGWDKGADDFLIKPVASVELLARIRTILRLRQAIEDLRASEQHYRRLIEILPDGVLLINANGQFQGANPQAIAMLGFQTEGDLVQSSIFQLVLASQQQSFRELLALPAQSVRNQEFTLIRQNGRPLPVEISTSSLDTAESHPKMLVLVVRDISFRKEAEAAIEKGRFLRKAILDNISDPAWLKDSQGRFLACNQAMAGFYGKTPEQIVGLTAAELATSMQIASESDKEDTLVMRSKGPRRFERERTDARGEKRWWESVKSPLFAQNGECIGTVGIARDMTERRRLEEELRLLSRRIIEAQEAERLRVARELHDGVNQLLASAQMRIRRVERSLVDVGPATREILTRCHNQIMAALEENRRIAHGLRPTDLDELGLAVSCRNFCQQFRTRTNLKLRFQVKGLKERTSREIELNLFRIVQEALANIEKHAHAKEVRVSLLKNGSNLVLKIEDDGRGFDSEQASTRRSKGGLGQTNMKERAASVGGTCETISVPGKGTTITVRIPLGTKPRASSSSDSRII